MARGELIRKLLLSHMRGNDEEFRSAAMQVISEEENKNNHKLAKDLLRIIENNNAGGLGKPLFPGNGFQVPKDQERQTQQPRRRQQRPQSQPPGNRATPHVKETGEFHRRPALLPEHEVSQERKQQKQQQCPR